MTVKTKEYNELQIRKIVLDIANKLSDPNELLKECYRHNHASTFLPITLSHGFPGTIILFSELDRKYQNQQWDYIAHEHFKALANVLKEGPIDDISLFTGLTGISFATYIASKNRKRYKKFLKQLDEIILKRLDLFLHSQKKIHAYNKGTKAAVYDVISGLAGINRYLLLTSDKKENLNMAKRINSFIIQYIVKDINIDQHYVPGWYINKQNSLEKEKELYPKGSFNLGLSHGISGVLAMLSLSYSKGIIEHGHAQAIKYIVDWILKLKSFDEYGVVWPGRISFDNYIENNCLFQKSARESWCYGNPGILRALFLASKSLNDENLKRKVVNAYSAIYLRKWNLESVTFCHGKSGLLQTTIQMQKDIKNDIFIEDINKLISIIIGDYCKSYPYGFKDMELKEGTYSYIDKVGLLEGSVGVALSLFSSINKNHEIYWDSAFLIN